MTIIDLKKSLKSSDEWICRVHREHLLTDLGHYQRPSLPVMPGAFDGMSEEHIIGLLNSAARNAEQRQRDKDLLTWFGAWRNDVMKHEALCEGNILFLLRAAGRFVSIGDDETACKLMAYAGEQYGFHITEADMTEDDRSEIARRYSRCRGAMSDKLLGGKKPTKAETEKPPAPIGLSDIFKMHE